MGWAKELLRAVSELCSKHAVFASLPSKLVPFLGHISSFMHAPPLLYHLFVVVYWYHELLECLRFTCSLYLLDILLPVVVIGDVLLLIRREVFFSFLFEFGHLSYPTRNGGRRKENTSFLNNG